ncbi:hypothetical protein [Microbulbifer sp. A4B17]|uniref:hypothetical protein n=1 Tax=Microbulbifer sp. A4B17 TaxID=359370 RepID=UPI001300A853|nr:hypothetical protein [Microbulbifer sp. A4B17]
MANAVGRAAGYNYDLNGAVPEVETAIDSSSGVVLVTVNAGVEDGVQIAKVEYRKSVQDLTCLDGSPACYTVDKEVKTTYSVKAR